MDFLKIDNINKTYGNTEVLKNINLKLDAGNFLVLVGPSGCGKSTLLNIIAGLETLDNKDGKIYINKKDVTQLPPALRNIAMVFQSYALYPNMTVRRNIAFGLKMRKTAPDEIDKKVKYVSEILEIEHLLERRPAQLSGGQRQRVAMGRAIVRDPQIFLFDEPLSNLDAKLRVQMRSQIKKLHRRLKATIVYVTHDQIEALTLADYIAVMSGGQIQQFGKPDEIYQNPVNIFTAGFMGSTTMNFIETVLEHEQKNYYLNVLGANESLKFSLANYRFKKALPKQLGQKIIMGVRPEDITLAGQNETSHPNFFRRRVEYLETAGSDYFAEFLINNTTVTARLFAKTKLNIDSEYGFLIAAENMHLFDAQTKQNIAFMRE